MPFGVSCRSSAATSTPYFLAKPAAAGVGSPSGLNAADTGGPVTSSSKSVCRSASLATRAVSRRGVLKLSAGASVVSRELLQPRVEVLRQLRRQPRQPARRNLLAADLDQQFAIHQLRALRPPARPSVVVST